MKPRTVISIRKTFRHILLVTPVAMGGSSCVTSTTGGGCPDRTSVMAAGVFDADGGRLDGGFANCTTECVARGFSSVKACEYSTDAGEQLVSCTSPGFCPGGRRTHGLVAAGNVACESPVGRFLAGMAHLEAASIHSFIRLTRELRAVGAPAELVARARHAARDEVAHARMMTALAVRHGATPVKPVHGVETLRTLKDVAMENAAEGCVSETYAALMACWQAHHAQDEALRTAFTQIADEETRHAELAWDIHAWATGQLSEADAADVSAAAHGSAARLHQSLMDPVDETLVATAGVPGLSASHALFQQLSQNAWATL